MITQALQAVAEDLNRHLGSSRSSVSRVVLGPVANDKLQAATVNDGKLVMTLINIQQFKTGMSDAAVTSRTGTTLTRLKRPIDLNLSVMFSASFEHYTSALSTLSKTIQFMHNKPFFEHSNTKNFPKTVKQLNFNLMNLGLDEQSHLWSSLGASYMPSVVYMVRMLSLPGDTIDKVKAVDSITHEVLPK